eukprot:6204678-Pleurochrysis_carterae.AAC.5
MESMKRVPLIPLFARKVDSGVIDDVAETFVPSTALRAQQLRWMSLSPMKPPPSTPGYICRGALTICVVPRGLPHLELRHLIEAGVRVLALGESMKNALLIQADGLVLRLQLSAFRGEKRTFPCCAHSAVLFLQQRLVLVDSNLSANCEMLPCVRRGACGAARAARGGSSSSAKPAQGCQVETPLHPSLSLRSSTAPHIPPLPPSLVAQLPSP